MLQVNNRTHREMLIVDGTTAFIGGAGIADWWYRDGVKGRRWRDMMMRVEGPSVAALQAVFAQNWLRVAGRNPQQGKSIFNFLRAPITRPRLSSAARPRPAEYRYFPSAGVKALIGVAVGLLLVLLS